MLILAWLPMSILHTVYVYERDEPRVGKRDKRENRDGLQRVCCCVCARKTSEPHWPDELCSLQRGDFSEMRGSKPGD